MTHILVIDNYDSFVYTLNGYLHQLGATSDVVRNDEISLDDLPGVISAYDGLLVSPGPGNPNDAGVSIAIVQEDVAGESFVRGDRVRVLESGAQARVSK
jgi:para-aminobenzoate synthetase component 2